MSDNTSPAPSGGTRLLVHGTLTGYHRYGCRCPECTRRAVTHDAKRRRLTAYGQWKPRTDAEQVRVHLRALALVPLTRQQIALRSGLNPNRIKQILNNGARSIRTIDATAVLNVPIPNTPTPSLLTVDATATRRRLQALITCGYTMPVISRTIGIADARYLWRVVHRRQAGVTAATALAASNAYNLLWDQPPALHGVTPAQAARAKALAARHRWAPPMAWDDDTIHDLNAAPDWTARCGTPGGYYDHTQIGTPTCQRCRDAVAAAAAERKTRRRNRTAA